MEYVLNTLHNNPINHPMHNYRVRLSQEQKRHFTAHTAQKTHLHYDRTQIDGVNALRKTYHFQACSTVRQSTSQKQLQDTRDSQYVSGLMT